DAAALQPLRTRLQWLEHQARLALAEGDPRLADWEARAAEVERALLEQRRRLRIAAGDTALPTGPGELDAAALVAALPPRTALVSWFLLDQRWLACVAGADGLRLVDGDAAGLAGELTQLRFQIDALRFGEARLAGQLPRLVERARLRLQAVHRRLLAPLAPLLAGCERLVLLPHGPLNGLPFAALHDGRDYLIDRHDLSLAPSAAVWLEVARRAPRPMARALVAGHGEGLPQVAAEVAAVAAALGPGATLLCDGAATRAAVAAEAAEADLIHLACHGRFRADSPAFSSLALADGAWTLFDIEALRLRAELVCLSACETAQGELAPGDELVGLTRGFLLAGASNVVSTLWTVGDDSCARLMADLYARLGRGEAPAKALCAAQRALASLHPHPYHWAAYTLNGRG
ncbi:MAG TPA: CHAT domain-containing protein, partial [Methylibium sp.]|nr:CHAT domain-containing protein [Methylibium sp.]